MKSNRIKRMAGISLLMAMVVVLQMLSGVIPPVGGFSISLVLIPIILGAAEFGSGVGAWLGAVFGVVVYINCMTGSDPGGQMVFQASPFLCFAVVLGKGVLAGFLSGLVYHALKKRNAYLAMLCAAVVCPAVNTGVFVVSMLLIFRDVLAQWAGGGDILAYVLSGLMLANFLPELIINLVFSPAGQRILNALHK